MELLLIVMYNPRSGEYALDVTIPVNVEGVTFVNVLRALAPCTSGLGSGYAPLERPK